MMMTLDEPAWHNFFICFIFIFIFFFFNEHEFVQLGFLLFSWQLSDTRSDFYNWVWWWHWMNVLGTITSFSMNMSLCNSMCCFSAARCLSHARICIISNLTFKSLCNCEEWKSCKSIDGMTIAICFYWNVCTLLLL